MNATPDLSLAELEEAVAARLAEVEQEQADRQAAHAQEDAAFGIELDAEIADKRQKGAPAYADVALAAIHALCDETAADNAETVAGKIRAMHEAGRAA